MAGGPRRPECGSDLCGGTGRGRENAGVASGRRGPGGAEAGRPRRTGGGRAQLGLLRAGRQVPAGCAPLPGATGGRPARARPHALPGTRSGFLPRPWASSGASGGHGHPRDGPWAVGACALSGSADQAGCQAEERARGSRLAPHGGGTLPTGWARCGRGASKGGGGSRESGEGGTGGGRAAGLQTAQDARTPGPGACRRPGPAEAGDLPLQRPRGSPAPLAAQ